MPANVDGMVREGISAYRAGRKEEARKLLMRAVELDEYNEQAWLWLSAVVDSVEEQRTCLENVLAINPNNERAKQGIQVLSQKSGSTAGQSSKGVPSQPEDVLASSSFKMPVAKPTTSPAKGGEDELPSSIEWDAPVTASSSSSVSHQVSEPSSQEYDDWMSRLNLGSKGSSGFGDDEPLVSSKPTPAKPPSFDDDADDFAALKNSLQATSAEELDDDAMFSFSSGPFSAPDASPLPPAAAAKTPPERKPAARPAPKKSPGREKAEALLDELELEQDDQIGFGDGFDQVGFDAGKMDASEFFQFIPKEIKATRLPGTRERYPILVILGLLVLIALNVGAVALLVTNLISG